MPAHRPPPAIDAREAQYVGRFVLRRVLGSGAQGTVWLAHDPRLARDVALKLLTAAAEQPLGDWLAEARAVAALTHPHIVPVYEADVHLTGAAAQPYLVFEYIEGAALDRHLADHGPYAPREAVEWLLGAVDALAEAHAAGVVHRDLKPSNLLVDAAGRARITDFGIAAAGGVHAPPAGSPRYLAPEVLRGATPAPAVDVFALGLLLAELLLGRALVQQTSVVEIARHIESTDLALPAEMPQPVDDALRAIVRRALARDPAQRLPDAGALRDALDGWLRPLDGSLPPSGHGGALDFLLRRMRHKTDFPALSHAVVRIQQVAASDNENVGTLAGEILKDVALTHKLLRLVNTAHYASAAGGAGITTVSRAVALIGFAGVRNLALSLVLVEHMNDKLHAQQIQQEFLRALLAGTLAEELCPAVVAGAAAGTHGLAEEAFLGAMFQNLGRLLTEFYFPEEAEQIRRLVHPGAVPARERPRQPVAEPVAAHRVLGLTFEELGQGVARHWGLPESLQRCMRLAAGAPPAQPPAAVGERLRWLATAANELADTLLHRRPAEAAHALIGICERHGRTLGVPAQDVRAALERARARLTELAGGLAIRLQPGALAQRLLADGKTEPAVVADTLADVSLATSDAEPTWTLAAARGRDRAAAADPAAVLAAGIQEVTDSLVDDAKLGEVLRMILETMYRALGFHRVLLCLREPKAGVLVGRFQLGDGDTAFKDAFRVATRPSDKAAPDMFSAVCLKGADTLIADATTVAMRARLPRWFVDTVGAPAFLLLPLMMKGAPVGLIYADKLDAGAIALDDKELALLRTLRSQAVMALRQAGAG